MGAKVTWKGEGLSFSGTADSGFSLDLGASPTVGGADDGFRPMELMALSVAGCTAMDVISILTKKRQEVTAFEVKVDTTAAETYPKVWTSVRVEYLITGRQVDKEAVERAIHLSATRYCPAQNMIDKVVNIEHTYKIIEAEV